MGVYSTLGNHDYGDYVHWDTAEEKKANLEKLKEIHLALGWRLLMNEHVVLQKEMIKLHCSVLKIGATRPGFLNMET
jgi:hypothetical protein